jgi:hypothetical protein
VRRRIAPGILLGGPDGPRLLLCVLPHGPELVENEHTAVLAKARLAVENRPRGPELDRRGDHHHDGECQQESDQRSGDIEEPLDDLRTASLDEAVGEDEPTRPDGRDQDLPGGLLIESRPVLHADTTEPAFQQRLGREAASAVHLSDDHNIRAGFLDEDIQILGLPEEHVPSRHHVRRAGLVIEKADDAEGPSARRLQVGDHSPDVAGPDHEGPDRHLLLRPGSEEGRAPAREPQRGQDEDPEERGPTQSEAWNSEPDRSQDKSRGSLADQHPGRELAAG